MAFPLLLMLARLGSTGLCSLPGPPHEYASSVLCSPAILASVFFRPKPEARNHYYQAGPYLRL